MQWIKSYKMEQPVLCERLINGFKTARELGFAHEGVSAKGVDKAWKDSEDVSLNCLPIEVYTEAVRAYREHVMASVRLYMAEFPVLTTSGAKIGYLEPPQIQHYEPGGAFFGESMFATAPDASKMAFVCLVRQLARWGFSLVDSQVHTDHLARFGAKDVSRMDYLHQLRRALNTPTRQGPWRFEGDPYAGLAADDAKERAR